MATKTGNTYISCTVTDRMTIPTANLGVSTTPSTKKLTTPGRLRQWPTTRNCNTYWTWILQLLVVDRCRNHLANLLSSWTSSKIPNLALEFRRYLSVSEFHRCNYFRFWRPYRYFRLSVAVVLIYRNYFPPVRGLVPQICCWNFNCTFHSFRDISTSG